ncbi:hypothetical protein [Natrinema salifodinae]|uniref:Uncharacterized protein n=1 Tax=Natrinema salifodinae TaxID=1202768 RepID=A0A1I0NL65_9EURY|nr:hypothetical protein [Natrinema salifodinae]SEW01930.1 hypothetical protein SAMN05216285_1841 [Natrinema salifodinae]
MKPIVLVLLLIALSSIPVALGLIVQQDAKRKGLDDPDRWFAIVALTAGTGVILYLLERDDRASRSAPADAEFPLPGASVRDDSGESSENE